MDKFYENNEENRKATELENTKWKLKMISRNSKSSKPSVDDYINNILGSGLKFNKPIYDTKCESQSLKNVHYNDIAYKRNNFNQSCNLHSEINNGYTRHREESEKLPSLYKNVIDIVQMSTCELDTKKIYDIFITSGLNQDILGAIWSLINRTSPGKLTKEELVAGLAMIAVCQEQFVMHGPSVHISLPTWEHIVSLSDLPVPKITIDQPIFITEKEPKKLIFSETNDEWADFSGFTTNEKTTEEKHDTIETAANNLNVSTNLQPKIIESTSIQTPIVFDIYQEINNQFSNWQDNIQTNKICTTKKSEENNKQQHNNEIHINERNNVNKNNVNDLHSVMDNDFGDFQIFSSNGLVNEQNERILDRYELFNCEKKGPHDNLIDQWIRCLTQAFLILSNTVSVLKKIEDEVVKIDVFNTDKGILLLKGIIEVYRVTRNIKLSASRSSILTASKSMLDQLSELEKSWNEFMLIIPDEMQIDVQSRLSRSAIDHSSESFPEELSLNNSCGVCLCRLDDDEGFLSHGLHKYHCPCANFWVNTLDLTLPGLTIPGTAL